MSDGTFPAGLLRKGLPWLTILLVLNGAYLLIDGSPSLFYVGNILLHVAAGIGLLVLWVFLAPLIVRMGASSGRALTALLLGSYSVAGLSGTALLILGGLHPYRWLLYGHIVSAALAAVLTLIWLVRGSFLTQSSRTFVFGMSAAAAAIVLVGSRPLWPGNPNDVIVNPVMPPPTLAEESMGGAEGPFFPSAAATSDGELIPSEFFFDSQNSCGRVGCHPDVTDQWESSAHHFSSFNNQFYRKSIEYMQDVAGLQKPQWCAGCHDPALLFAGKMAQPVAHFIDTPEAHAGLACVACHSIVSVSNTMGNGGYVIEYPAMHQLAESDNALLRGLHDFVVRLNPKPHRNAFLKPFHREQPAEFCSSCHKVHLDTEVNNYRWIRGFNSYDNWQASGVSGQGARSFYEPPEPRTCLTCHMPLVPSRDAGSKEGYVRSHRFPAANTALAHVNRDSVQLGEVTAFLKNGQLLVDILAVSEPEEMPPPIDDAALQAQRQTPQMATTFATAEEEGMALGTGSLTSRAVQVIGPLEDGQAVLKRGSSVRLEVVVRTLGLGHLFPSGTVDAQEAWLELQAVDSKGDTLFWSGWVADDGAGPVDPSAHFYRSLMVDARGNPINKRNAFHSRSVVYVNLIPPGAADVAHYRLEIPENVGAEVHLTARLHYRKFNHFYTQFAYAGVPDPERAGAESGPDFDDRPWIPAGDVSGVSGPTKEIPALPIVTMAEDRVTLKVVDGDIAALPVPTDRAAARMRWNDYGIGLLLEGDLKTAEQAFRRAVEMEPSYADGWVNLARVFLQEGNLDAAAEVLDEADRVRPGFHKADYFRGLYHKAQGEYPEALALLESVADRFPRDRVVMNDIGRVHFLNSEPMKAIPFFEQVLAIDSEDLTAHYNLMLCYRAAGDLERSGQHEQRYLRYKADEDTQAIAREYRQRHPHDNNEAQPIHEHRSFHHLRGLAGTPPSGHRPIATFKSER